MKIIGFILAGIASGISLFVLGDMDDAPGLSFIGLIIAFLLIMRGIYHAKVMKRGYHIPFILFVFGVMGITFPLVLFLDGEIEGFSSIMIVGNIIGILMIAIALIRIRKVKKETQT